MGAEPPAPLLLAVAGDDPGAGAGLQMDRRMALRLGCAFLGVVAVHTRQDGAGLHEARPADPARFARELEEAFAAGPAAVKTGALGNAALVRILAEALERRPDLPVVVDPLRVASRGRRVDQPLLDEAGLGLLRARLFPRATVVTPNLLEYEDGSAFASCHAVYLKGGHAPLAGGGPEFIEDRLFRPGHPPMSFRAPRLSGGERVHGTGCALSSALACRLAQGRSLPVAAAAAHRDLQAFLREILGHDPDTPPGAAAGPESEAAQ